MSNTKMPMSARARAHYLVAVAGLMAACAGQAQTAGGKAQATGNSGAVLDFRTCAKPEYPHDELQAGHEGVVKLGFLVKADGTVGETRVLASTGFAALDEEARTALAKCQFTPATRDGQPVESWTDIQYVWSTK
jgi:TonB family protein